MLELVKYIVETFAEHKDEIEYRQTENEAEGTVEITVYLASSDMGKVIGREGKIAKAMRTLVRAAAPRDGKKYVVEIREKSEM
ncbi:MAG: KH domain-containing protein [Clostridia bacterium]|nr:KH domain-containing protein [Clostridia bacterium]